MKRLVIPSLLLAALASWAANPHLAVVARKNVAAGGFDKTGLVAWWDFDNANDSHDAGPYNLTETGGAPTYTNGYGVGVSASSKYWINASVGSVVNTGTNADHTIVMRWRVKSSYVSNRTAFHSLGGRGLVRKGDAGTSGVWNYRVNNIFKTGSTNPNGAWMLSIFGWNASTQEVEVYEDNGSLQNGTGTPNWGNAEARFCDTAGTDVDIDFAAGFSRLLTAGERTTLYNGGATITYGDL